MIGRGIAAAVLLAGFAAPAAADFRSEELVRGWLSLVDAHPDWSASAAQVSSQGQDTLIEGLSFSRVAPDVGIAVARVRLRDLAERPGGGFSATEIEASGGTLASSAADVTIPAAAAKSISMPALPALVFDPKQVLTFVARTYSALAEAELADLAVPEITVVQRAPSDTAPSGAVATATYRDVRLTDLRSGVISRSDVGRVSVAMQEGGSGDSSFEIAGVEVERTDLGAIAHILDEARYRDGQGDGVWRSALARLRYSGLVGSGPDGAAFRFDEFSVENVDVRQPPRPFVSRLENMPDDADTPEETRLALETVADFLASFRVGALRMNGLAVESPAPETGSMSLQGITVLGWSGAGIDAFDLRDLRFASPQGSGALKSMEFAGLVFPEFSAFLDIVGLDEDEPDGAVRAAAIRKALYALPKLKRFAMAGLSGGALGVEVSLDELALNLDRYVGPFPASAQFSLDGLHIPGQLLRLDPQSAEVFDGLGLTDLVVGMTVGETWDPSAGRVDAVFDVTLKEAGDFDLAYTYAGVTEEWLISAIAAAAESPGESDTEAVLKVLDGLGLESATLKLTDRSLLDRGFGFAAKKQNLTIEGPAYREQMRGALPFMLSMAISPDLAKLLTAPLQSFLAGGQTLVVEARPAAPIPLPALNEAIERDPMSLPGLLNLTIRSEPAPAKP